MNIASYIDHTILKPETTPTDIDRICTEAVQYGFASVCVPPYFVAQAKNGTAGSGVHVATVVGFPFGYSHATAKAAEITQALLQGADELDVVIHIAALVAGDLKTLEHEIETITNAIGNSGATLKLILETGLLSDSQIETCCMLYRQHPVQFLKTSTGYAARGASVAAVRLLRRHLPAHIGIKASGGIRDFAFAKSLIDAGATRLGCSASVAIAQGAGAGAGNY